MPLFAYKGIDAAGRAINGTREADGPKGLRQLLRRESVFLTEVREVKAGDKATQRGARQAGGSGALNREVDFKALLERVRSQDVSIFTRQLATLLKAGIITDRTRPNYTMWVDMDELERESDDVVGTDVAEEGIAYLRDINKNRKKIGRALKGMA